MCTQTRDRPSKVKGGSFHHGKVGNSSRVICQQNSSTDCMLLPVPVPDDAKLPYFLPFVPKGVTKAQRQIQLTREKRDETAHGKHKFHNGLISIGWSNISMYRQVHGLPYLLEACGKVTIHSGFLEYWNSKKIVCNIWQRFSRLLDEGIPKICKKLNSCHAK